MLRNVGLWASVDAAMIAAREGQRVVPVQHAGVTLYDLEDAEVPACS